MKNYNLPALSDGSLSDYLNEIKKFPMLSSEEEFMLAKAWVDHDDRKSAHRLVTSHLRLAAKIALGYRGYGLPINEVVSEANVGLMQAVKRFDPDNVIKIIQESLGGIRDIILTNTHTTYVKSYSAFDRPQRRLLATNSFLRIFPKYIMESSGLIVLAIGGIFLALNLPSPSTTIPILGSYALGSQKLLPALQIFYNCRSNKGRFT